ncbi:MAG: tetratricopeptide repeat protein [Deltaproteobacteria bacterium]|nr:tetratricopeptide repeat protein [Deltaproteobacteria bacterium]
MERRLPDGSLAGGSAGWLAPIARWAADRSGFPACIVENARDAALPGLLETLLDLDPGLGIGTDPGQLANAARGTLQVLRPPPSAGAWLEDAAEDVVSSLGLRLVLWMPPATLTAVEAEAAGFLARCARRFRCPDLPPAHSVAGLKAAASGPGVEWLGGPLATSLKGAWPRARVVWASARQDYDGLVASARTAGRSWLCWTDLDGPFRVRQVRWALAETGRRGRSVLVEPRVSSPGWWPVHGRTLDLSAAMDRISLAGGQRTGLMAALTGCEPEAVDLLEALLGMRVPEEEIVACLRGAPDPGVALAIAAHGQGLFTLEDVAGRLVAPPVQRAFGQHPEVRRVRRRTFSSIQERVESQEAGIPLDLIGHWAASSQGSLPEGTLDWSIGPEAAFLVEVVLRAGPDTAEVWRAAADAALRLGDPHVASRFAETALAMDASDPVTRSRILFTQGRAAFRDSRFPEAERLLERALDLQREALGPVHPETGKTLHALGLAQARQRRYREALKAHSHALAVLRKHLPEDHPDLAVIQHGIGQVLIHLGRYEEATRAYHRALAIEEKALGPDHPSVASTLHAMGQSLVRQGRYGEALEAFRRDLSISERALGPEHPSVAGTLHALGQALALADRSEEALECFHRALAIVERALGSDHRDVANALDAIGQTLIRLDRVEEAVATFRRALEAKERTAGPHHPDTAATLHALGDALARTGDHEQALECYRRALSIRQITPGAHHPFTAFTWHAIGQSLSQIRRHAEAVDAFDRALAIKVRALGPDHPETAITRFERGRAMRNSGDPAGVAQMMGALGILERELAGDHPMVRAARTALFRSDTG